MRTRLPIVAIALFSLFLTGSVAIAGQQVEIAWKFNAGDVIHYRMTSTNETEMPGGMGVMVVESVMGSTWSVLDINDAGEARVRVSTDRMQMNMDSPMGNMQFDSDRPESSGNPALASAGAMVGTSYVLVFDESGDVIDIEGLEELQAKVAESAGSNPQVAAAMEQMASEEGIKNMMRQGMSALPDGPVSPGDTWDSDFSMALPMLGSMSNQHTMTFDRIEETEGARLAVINTDGTVEFSMDQDAGNPMAGMMEMGESVFNGTMFWDVDRGRFVRSDMTMTMQMFINANGQEMSILTVMNMQMEIVDAQ